MIFIHRDAVFRANLDTISADDALMGLKTPSLGGLANDRDGICGASFCANPAIGAILGIHLELATGFSERLPRLERVEAGDRLVQRIPQQISQQFHKTISIN